MSQKPQVLRVKRKRDEEAPDTIVIDAPSHKKLNSVQEISKGLENLFKESRNTIPNEPFLQSSSSSRLTFHRIHTISSNPSSDELQRIRQKYDERKSLKSKYHDHRIVNDHFKDELHEKLSQKKRSERAQHRFNSSQIDPLRMIFKLYDLVGAWFSASNGSSSVDQSSLIQADQGKESNDGRKILLEGIRLVRRRIQLYNPSIVSSRCNLVPQYRVSPGRILNPIEKQLDHAVWQSFSSNDFNDMFRLLQTYHDISFVNYQRLQSDLTTPLMAATYHGHVKMVFALLKKGALVRIPNAFGQTAIDIAKERGFDHIASFLRDVLQDEEDELALYFGSSSRSKIEEHDDNAYDLYALEDERTSDQPVTTESKEKLSPTYQLADGMYDEFHAIFIQGDQNVIDEEYDKEVLLVHENERDEELEGDDDDYDSNAEDAEGNEYPDDEDGNQSDDYFGIVIEDNEDENFDDNEYLN
jgi:hypothetical protein